MLGSTTLSIACIEDKITGAQMVSFALVLPIHLLQSDVDISAEEFDPDRFIDERLHKYLTPNPFIFLPFNAGPRICLGQQFAYNEMSFFMIRLLQNFETIIFDHESQPPASRPPAEWRGLPGRKGVEKFWPKVHLTLYSEVRVLFLLYGDDQQHLMHVNSGRYVGQDGRSKL